MCVCIYIYIYRERETERPREGRGVEIYKSFLPSTIVYRHLECSFWTCEGLSHLADWRKIILPFTISCFNALFQTYLSWVIIYQISPGLFGMVNHHFFKEAKEFMYACDSSVPGMNRILCYDKENYFITHCLNVVFSHESTQAFIRANAFKLLLLFS